MLTLCTIILIELIKNKPFFWNYLKMETATLVAIFISCSLVSFTGYALYTAFGQPSKELRDPFEEHED
uniref:Protein PsbN n=14 Tax=Hypnales TaxID=13798 RepID=Q71NQ0_9BRYO|nr:photosystem II protein N [Barbella flagellifera]AAQ03620.1 photosystem II N protein [Aerobryidium filamentosum]AAQ03668.1 photosystem II N protein [Barbellopsis trichophora]AAQ03704.1 photosystem II N protein [Duthiella wallichii]AAQ03725.1 photosystem II N protein [Sinskea phaea]AAQ03728.1 photosystem II N protein [Pseudospiridentopsis horrida]AAQ03770.1 photosystem II N protein [Trachycladiella aurea]AAQ03785.1 photosystem II N protein [Neobarbella comes]AAQ03803.1 photosystem II N pro